jgi:hypothetical protein
MQLALPYVYIHNYMYASKDAETTYKREYKFYVFQAYKIIYHIPSLAMYSNS